MKHLFSLLQLAAAALLMTLAGHASALEIFACEPEWAALAQDLGGTSAQVFVATTAMQDPHRIEARPSLIARLRRADLLVCSGAELEAGWLPMLQRQSGNARVQPGSRGFFESAMVVERLEIPSTLDRAQGDLHAAGNPHVHLDPRRLALIAKALAERMKEIDPAHRSDYEARFADFDHRWSAALLRWSRLAAPLKGKRAVVYHRNWTYLFDWLGMQEAGTLEPRAGVPPSAAHLAELKQLLAGHPADMIIYASYQDPRAAEWLANQTRIPVVGLPFTVGGSERAGDLFGLFDDTLERLLKAAP